MVLGSRGRRAFAGRRGWQCWKRGSGEDGPSTRGPDGHCSRDHKGAGENLGQGRDCHRPALDRPRRCGDLRDHRPWRRLSPLRRRPASLVGPVPVPDHPHRGDIESGADRAGHVACRAVRGCRRSGRRGRCSNDRPGPRRRAANGVANPPPSAMGGRIIRCGRPMRARHWWPLRPAARLRLIRPESASASSGSAGWTRPCATGSGR